MLQSDLLEQAEAKLKKCDAEPEVEVANEKIEEIKIEEAEPKPVKNVSIVDQMMESIVTKYSAPAQPTTSQTVKIKLKEVQKESKKEVLTFNNPTLSSISLNEQPVEPVPKIKLSIKPETESEKEIDIINMDENAMDGLVEKAPESILWKPVCTDENLKEPEKIETPKIETR